MTGHSRNTVKKALRSEAWGHQERLHQPFPVLGPHLGTIELGSRRTRSSPGNSVIQPWCRNCKDGCARFVKARESSPLQNPTYREWPHCKDGCVNCRN